jgi:hypothetical protein
MPTPGVIKNIYISVKNTGIYSGGVAVYIRKNADLGSDQITAINNPSIATSSTGSSSNLTANLAFVAGDKLSIRMDTSFPNGPTTVQISTLTFDY